MKGGREGVVRMDGLNVVCTVIYHPAVKMLRYGHADSFATFTRTAMNYELRFVTHCICVAPHS